MDLIDEGEVNICTVTEDNIPQYTKFTKLKFKNTEDFVAEFPIPAKISRITIKVSGKIKVEKGSGKDHLKVQDSH